MTIDPWVGAEDYEAYIGRWSRPVGAEFLDWLSVAPGGRWVDVGCGTGALSGLILELADPASVIGVDPSADFVELARTQVDDPRARFVVAPADHLPLDAAAADVIVSGLVLNFIPDLAAALTEMRRVGVASATIAGYLWDLAGRMDIIRTFWDAAIALDAAAAGKDEGARFPLCAPEPLRRAFEGAGMTDVVVRSIDVPTVFRDFDDYWTPFLGRVGPAPAYLDGLDEASRAALRERLRATLPTQPDGTIHLVARAWAVRGRNGGWAPRSRHEAITPVRSAANLDGRKGVGDDGREESSTAGGIHHEPAHIRAAPRSPPSGPARRRDGDAPRVRGIGGRRFRPRQVDRGA